jgi:hypothetical protein
MRASMGNRKTLRRVLLVVVAVLVVALLGVFVTARRLLGSDSVRTAIAQQLSAALGQPVRIDTAGVSLFPRLAVELHRVAIGDSAAVSLGEVRVATGWRGLLSRTVEDAEITVTDTTITLPLPFSLVPASGGTTGASGASGFTITSIRRISLRGVDLVAGQHTLHVDMEAGIERDTLTVDSLTASAATTSIDAHGTMSSMAQAQGQFEATANPLDLDEMFAFAGAFTTPAPRGRAPSGTADSPMHIVLRLTAPRGNFGAHAFTDLSTTIDLRTGQVALAPLAVRVFDGTVQGKLAADTSRAVPRLTLNGRLDHLDAAALMADAGSPGSLTGRLAGTAALTADGTAADALLRTARGTIDIIVADGRIPGLDMVRSVILAFGKPSGAPPEGSGSAFTRLGGTFALADGRLTSDNLALASRDFDLAGHGSLRLPGGGVEARADVVLSRELTAQAGTDLRRYAEQDGRVVLPARIDGTITRPVVFIDVEAAARRALQNELKRRTKSLLDRLFKKQKG